VLEFDVVGFDECFKKALFGIDIPGLFSSAVLGCSVSANKSYSAASFCRTRAGCKPAKSGSQGFGGALFRAGSG